MLGSFKTGYLIGLLALAGVIVASVGIVVINDYRDRKVATLEPPYRAPLGTSGDPADIVIFGDSRAAEWPLQALQTHGRVVNAGIPGEVTASMVSRLSTDVIPWQADWVVLVAGINDLVAQSLIDEQERTARFAATVQAFDMMLETLVGEQMQVIIVLVTPPLQIDPMRWLAWGGGIEDSVTELNGHLVTQCARQPQLHCVDALEAFAATGPGWQPRVRRDALHYSAVGYEALNREVGLVLRGGA